MSPLLLYRIAQTYRVEFDALSCVPLAEEEEAVLRASR